MNTDAEEASPNSGPREKPKKVQGIVIMASNRCKGCGFCIEFCPPQVLGFSQEFNSQGYHIPVLLKPNQCTGCDLCGLYCPDFAIYGVMVKTNVNATAMRAPGASASGTAP